MNKKSKIALLFIGWFLGLIFLITGIIGNTIFTYDGKFTLIIVGSVIGAITSLCSIKIFK